MAALPWAASGSSGRSRSCSGAALGAADRVDRKRRGRKQARSSSRSNEDVGGTQSPRKRCPSPFSRVGRAIGVSGVAEGPQGAAGVVHRLVAAPPIGRGRADVAAVESAAHGAAVRLDELVAAEAEIAGAAQGRKERQGSSPCCETSHRTLCEGWLWIPGIRCESRAGEAVSGRLAGLDSEQAVGRAPAQ